MWSLYIKYDIFKSVHGDNDQATGGRGLSCIVKKSLEKKVPGPLSLPLNTKNKIAASI